MSAIAPSDNVLAAKKKGNKKKKAKGKMNGDASGSAASGFIAGDEGEEEQELTIRGKPSVDSTATRTTEGPVETSEAQVNGHKKESSAETTTTDDAPDTADETPDAIAPASDTSNGADASATLEAMSASREALRAQVEELRKALEDIQETHNTELSTIRAELSAKEAENEDARQRLEREKEVLVEQHAEEREAHSVKVRETIKKIQVKLGRFHDLEGENEVLEGRVQELQEELERERANQSNSGEQIEELRRENKEQQEMVNRMAQQIGNLSEENSRLAEENRGYEKELNYLRSTQNDLFAQNRTLRDTQEELVAQNRHLKEEADVAREECEEWRQQTEYHRSRCEELMERVVLLEPLEQQGHQLQAALKEAEKERKRVFEEWQMKVDGLRMELEDRDMRTQGAEEERDVLAKKLEMYESEKAADTKRKEEEITEFRQKWIMEREAVKKVQRENRRLAKINPMDYIEKQIVTSHLTKFLSLDRADPTRFQILQALAGMLSWSESDNEKAGLARPGAASVGSASSLRVPSLGVLYKTPSSPNLSGEFGGAGSLPETPMSGGSTRGSLWGFIGRGDSSRAGSKAGSVSGETVGGKESEAPTSRSASISSVPPK